MKSFRGGRFMFLVLVSFVFFIGFAEAVIPEDCDYSMLSYWKMDGDSTDSVGGSDGGSWPGNGSLKVNVSANFSGSESITTSDVGDVLTLEMWIQKEGAPVANSTLLEGEGYLIEYLDDNRIRGSVNGVNVFSGSLSVGIPYHVALVWEATAERLVLYINGNNVSSNNLLSFGDYVDGVTLGKGFVGLMDEVAVYSRSFNSGDIGVHYDLSNTGKDYCDASGVNGTSTTKADFNIAGCNLPNGDGLILSTCSRGEIDGEYYCDGDRNLWETRELGMGCSMGLDTNSWELGDDYCCPAGMLCNETSGAFKCDYRLEQCWNQTNEADCRSIGCVWLEEESVCADGTRDYGCSLYNSQSRCETDVWNLGRNGVGTEVCGTTMECDDTLYTIPYESCECKWNSASGICELYMEGGETYYDNLTTREWFSCSKNYSIGECLEGEQDIFWIASSSVNNGFDENCLDTMSCSNGSSVRQCGEPVIKLPVFSLFAFFISVFIIGVYYVFSEGFK